MGLDVSPQLTLWASICRCSAPERREIAARERDGVGLWLGTDACAGIGSGGRFPST